MRYNLVCVFHPGDERQDNGLFDVINAVWFGLKKLGHAVSISRNEPVSGARNIFFGAHADRTLRERIQPDDIVFNLEQHCATSRWFGAEYLDLLRTAETWDYSRKNIESLDSKHGIRPQFCRLGYAPELARLRRDFPKDIDILFYGAMNERRKAVLDTLTASKLHVVCASNAFGKERDGLIARSKVVVNIHYYESAILETARLSYLWTNHKAVVSELPDVGDLYPGLENACVYSDYESLANTALRYACVEKKRLELEEIGHAAWAEHPIEMSLEPLVGKAKHFPEFSQCPRKLNVGSGKDFRPDCLNLDINADWGPDAVMDISVPIPDGLELASERFGKLELRHGAFDKVIMHDVLEHVPDVIAAMTNVADLLADGGEVDIIVPYDLSCEAWQDPTHLRAFNEKSWKYYTEWSWYVGWREYTFDPIRLDMTTGPSVPAELKQSPEILTMPRAVTSMHVVLRKRQTSDAEKLNFDVKHGRFYTHGAS